MKAWPAVTRRVPDATLSLFGKDRTDPVTGRRQSELIPAALPPSCRASVRWEGHVEAVRLRDAYRAAHVCVFPSLFEAFGLAAAEAMACGRPVVYTRHGAGPEVVEHGVSGLLCDPRDTAELAEAIVMLLQDRQRATRMGEAALERARQQFALPAVLQQNLQLYHSVLQRVHLSCAPSGAASSR
jgi:glycosyltransferase involved in cell wall biosynthesis